MGILMLMLVILILYKSKINIKGFYTDYLSKDKTMCIKGIFVILVFYRHCSTYIYLGEIIDKPIIILDNLLAQSIVTMFFFYSGYGIYEQIKKKGDTYIKEMPIKRLFVTFINFFIAVTSFFIMDIFLGTIGNYSLKTILLSYIGWESIGNSNWFMFAIFMFYIFVILSFNIFKKNNKYAIIFVNILTIVYSIIILQYKTQGWMNTSLCFVLGMYYSYYKDYIEEKLMINKNFSKFAIISIIVYIILNYIYRKNNSPIVYSIISCVFTSIIVMVTMKVSINNKILNFLGKNVFWMYILQRIPMITFSKLGLNNYKYTFFIICFIVTVGLSYLYTIIFDKKIIKIIEDKLLKMHSSNIFDKKIKEV